MVAHVAIHRSLHINVGRTTAHFLAIWNLESGLNIWTRSLFQETVQTLWSIAEGLTAAVRIFGIEASISGRVSILGVVSYRRLIYIRECVWHSSDSTLWCFFCRQSWSNQASQISGLSVSNVSDAVCAVALHIAMFVSTATTLTLVGLHPRQRCACMGITKITAKTGRAELRIKMLYRLVL